MFDIEEVSYAVAFEYVDEEGCDGHGADTAGDRGDG
jgi:hypothetical protein